MRPISAKVIYDTIAADTDIVSLLGTYEFRAGQVSPAISIVSPGQDLPPLRNVKGVECIIQDVGNVTPTNYLTDAADMEVKWQVFVVAFEPATGADLMEATKHICSKFAGSQSLQTVAASDGIGALVQNKIIIDSRMPIFE